METHCSTAPMESAVSETRKRCSRLRTRVRMACSRPSEYGAAATHSPEDEIKEDFLGKPKDWIDRFGRHFRITEHTHLEHNNEREILPWLRLAAEMDPQKIETYTVGSFFMRQHLNRPREAEAFLREGLRNNPNSYEILFELGQLYDENDHDTDRARDVWQLALRRWLQQDPQIGRA